MPGLSPSQTFILGLEPQRDRLYARACAASRSAPAAESLLQAATRKAFAEVLKDPETQPVAAVERELPPAENPPAAAMPADTWARLAAAVQIEAARTGGAKALNPDHVLLSPDPLLAPKKAPRDADLLEGLNLSPASLFMIATITAMVLGVLLTVYIITRPSALKAPTTTTSAPAVPGHAP